MNRCEAVQSFTVVIPTRERCDTLEHTLRTCVMQDYDRLEILVSDNYSQDQTREVVESFRDSRIRYLNTGKRVNMPNNFEFALSHVKPQGYVIYIGDDDGLLPNAMRDLNAVIGETEASAIRWGFPRYFWPTIEHSEANRLIIPSLSRRITTRDSAARIREVIRFRATYGSLPALYLFSVVRYEVVERVKKLSSNGRFFNSSTPDAYSGFAIAGVVESYLNSKRPYTISGTSHHSLGASTLEDTTNRIPRRYFDEEDYPYHPSMVRCLSFYSSIVESFFQAREHIPSLKAFSPDMEELFSVMMSEAARRPERVYTEIKDAVLRMGELNEMPGAARRAVAEKPPRAPGLRSNLSGRNIGKALRFAKGVFREDYYKGMLYLDCAPFFVKNIYDASVLCHHILTLKDEGYLDPVAVIRSASRYVKTRVFSSKNRIG